jgi:hypothetical protein
MSVRSSVPLIAAVVAASAITFPSSIGAQDAPVLVGTWALNGEKTEPPKDKVLSEPEGTGAGGTMATGMGSRGATRRQDDVAGGSGRGGGGSGGGGGARGGGGSRSNFRLIFGGMMSPSKTLKVLQADSIVSIDDEDGPVFLNLRTDNKVLEEQLPNGTVLKTKAQWRKNELVVERNHDTDGSARLIIRIDAKNPKTMIVDFHYEHKRQRRTIDQRRIYDAAM